MAKLRSLAKIGRLLQVIVGFSWRDLQKLVSWRDLQKLVNELIDEGSCIEAYKALRQSSYGIKEIHFGRTVRKVAVRACEDDFKAIRDMVRADFFEAWQDFRCANIEQATNYGYIALLLREWESGFEALAKYRENIEDGPRQDLFDQLLFGYIQQLIDNKRIIHADKIIELAVSRSTFTDKYKRYFWKIIYNSFSKPHSSRDEVERNPLLNKEDFLAFLRLDAEIGKLFDDKVPSSFRYWVNDRSKWRCVQDIQRSKPLDRPIRILVTSNNWNFLQLPCSVLEEHGFELRYLPFDRVIEALNVRTDKADDTPNINQMIYGLGPFAVSQDDAIEALGKKCPWALNLIDWCDVAFVEFWNQPAVWMSCYLPKNKALVIRLHSYEAFTTLPSLTNMQGVESAIFIADHIRDIFNKTCLNAEFLNERQAVIQNIRPLGKHVPQKRSRLEKKTLCLAGYSNRNKDPNFALDILSNLLQSDSEWKLKLIGHPWQNEVSEDDLEYFGEFQKKLSTLSQNVEIGPYTNDILSHLEKCGFILSTSLREGSHETVVEGMSVGCIPIIRDWPHVSQFEAAQKMFPTKVIITSPKEAAEQILSFINDYEAHSAKQYEIFNNSYSRKFSAEKLTGTFDKLYSSERRTA